MKDLERHHSTVPQEALEIAFSTNGGRDSVEECSHFILIDLRWTGIPQLVNKQTYFQGGKIFFVKIVSSSLSLFTFCGFAAHMTTKLSVFFHLQ